MGRLINLKVDNYATESGRPINQYCAPAISSFYLQLTKKDFQRAAGRVMRYRNNELNIDTDYPDDSGYKMKNYLIQGVFVQLDTNELQDPDSDDGSDRRSMLICFEPDNVHQAVGLLKKIQIVPEVPEPEFFLRHSPKK